MPAIIFSLLSLVILLGSLWIHDVSFQRHEAMAGKVNKQEVNLMARQKSLDLLSSGKTL